MLLEEERRLRAKQPEHWAKSKYRRYAAKITAEEKELLKLKEALDKKREKAKPKRKKKAKCRKKSKSTKKKSKPRKKPRKKIRKRK